MSRDGSGVYSKASASFVANSTITSASVNADFDDLVNDANTARPITAGGTAATSAPAALVNLGAVSKAEASFPTVGGTADALTLTPATALGALVDGVVYTGTVGAAANATSTPTLAVSATGAKVIRKMVGGVDVALLPGDLPALTQETFVYKTAASSGGGAWVVLSPAEAAPAIRGALFDLRLVNDATTPNTVIDMLAGSAASDGASPVLMTLAATINKSIASTWAVGSGNGGLDTGTVAVNTWYHVYLIKRPDTGVVDVLLSLSATAPTMPANYTLKRYRGSIKTDGSSHIIAFRHYVIGGGDVFKWATPVIDRNSASAQASALLTLTIPLGLATRPILSAEVVAATGVDIGITLGDAANGSANVTVARAINPAASNNTLQEALVDQFVSNTASQIYFQLANSTGAGASTLTTLGWIADGGRNV